MKSNYERLGNYIRLVDNRNSDLNTTLLRGVSTSKKLIKSVANLNGVEFSSYKVVQKGQFVYVSDTSRRGDKIAIAMSEEENCIVSSIYTVFEVEDKNILLPEFLLMWFKREEFDRYARFHSWGSARETFTWADMCDIRLPIPGDIEEQKKYVAIYNELMNNKQCYEKSLNDLQLICDSFMDSLMVTEESTVLGEYIQQSEEINTNLEVTNLLGISVDKRFFPSKSKQETLELSGYKIVRRRQFGFVTVTSRNGEKLSIALLEGPDGIVSSTYIVFGVIDENVLMPEFLFLWFKRPEFDRYARFHSWGSARETFGWVDMCEVKLPIPDIEVQKSIVAIHHTLESRKRINAKLKNIVTPLCPILIRGVINNLSLVRVAN